MSQQITNAFEQYWQSCLTNQQPVVLDEFILADIPNLDITSPIDPDTGLPPQSQIVHRQNVDQRGRINNNAVAYTIVMDTTVGDFSFNAMYLRNKANGVIGMIVYKGRETKLKTDQTTGQTGNSLVKSMLMGYDQAAEATVTNVDAGTWQIDYAARLRGMDEDIRQLQADLYGHHTFVGDGFKVVEKDGAYQVSQGVAIVGGLRVELKAPAVIHPGTKPIGVWVDVHRAGSLLSEHQNHFTIITSVADLTDHVDSNGYQHFVAKLGTILADSTIEDGRGSAGGGSGGAGSIPDTFALWKRSMAEAGYDLIGQFGTALTIETADQVVLTKDGNDVYAWSGRLPKDIDAGFAPNTELWSSVADDTLRKQLGGIEGAENIGFKQKGAGSVARTVEDKLNDFVSLSDFFDKNSSETDHTDYLAKANNEAVNNHVPLLLNRMVNVATPFLITADFIAPKSQVFTSGSLVSFGNDVDVMPEWFGRRSALSINMVADMLHAGNPVIFDCHGDSTMKSADPFNLPEQVARPAPEQLQIFLRFYYGNDAATVRNKGINSTNVRQMLNGSDGSGKTFDAHMKETDAAVIYCNHCLNSATDNSTSPDMYRGYLIEVVNICKKYGKTLVLETPNPCGGFDITTPYNAERLKVFAEVMRAVAKDTNTTLVDNFHWCEKVISSGKYTMMQLLADGIHPTQMLYLMKGQNMAIPIIMGGMAGFTGGDQYLPCTSSTVMASAGAKNNVVNGKFSKVLSTPLGHGSIRIAYLIEESALDVYMAHITWSDGSKKISITDDYTTLISDGYSMLLDSAVDFFLTDQEVCVIKNASPGMHILELKCDNGSVGFNYLRAVKTNLESVKLKGAMSSNYRVTLLEMFEFSSEGEGVIVIDSIPHSTLLGGEEYELTATMGKSSGLVLHGIRMTDQFNFSSVMPGLVIGLDSSGFLSVWEHDTVSMKKTVVLGDSDYSLTKRSWYIKETNTQLIIVDYMSGKEVEYNKTRSYCGGNVGFWKLEGGQQIIDRLVKIVRFS